MVQYYSRAGAQLAVGATSSISTGTIRLTDGSFLSWWFDSSTLAPDGSGVAIKAQKFAADGTLLGGEIDLGTLTFANWWGPFEATVAPLEGGGFVASWRDYGTSGADTDNASIRARVFDGTGAPSSPEFLVNTTVADAQIRPAIAGLAGGGFVIAWEDNSAGATPAHTDVRAQIFAADGSNAGPEFVVNTLTASFQTQPAVAALPAGEFLVAWSGPSGIKAQVFDTGGSKVGAEFMVGSASSISQTDPKVAVLTTGGFVVTWTEVRADTDVSEIMAQLFDAGRNKVGAAILVNTATRSSQVEAEVAALAAGGFAVTWKDNSGTGGDSSGSGIKAQIFGSDGTRLGGEFLVNDDPDGDQIDPSIVATANGFLISWNDPNQVEPGPSIRARFFTPTLAGPTEISLSDSDVGETAVENVLVATLDTAGPDSAAYTYSILSDSSHGAFRLDGDRLILVDSGRLDFETAPTVSLILRSQDANGRFVDRTVILPVPDASQEVHLNAGAETLVDPGLSAIWNPEIPDLARSSSSTVLGSGNIVLVWQDGRGQGGDVDPFLIMGRLFDASGAPLGAGFVVNTQSTGWQVAPAVASLPASGGFPGGFVVTWTDRSGIGADSDLSGIKGQLFDMNGAKVGAEFLVNSQTDGTQTYSEIAVLAGGGFVVTWTDAGGLGGDTSGTGVKAQLFDGAGAKVGGEILANGETDGNQSGASVAALAGGGFIVTWTDESGSGGDPDSGIKAQLFSSSGGKVGNEFLVNTTTFLFQRDPFVAALTGGGFVIAWENYAGNSGVTLQIFDAAGEKVGGEIAAAESYVQEDAAIAPLANGGFILSWTDWGTFDSDGSLSAIRAQIFDSDGDRVGRSFLVNDQTALRQMASTLSVLPSGEIVASWINDYSRLQMRIFDPVDVDGTPGSDVVTGAAQRDQIRALGGDDSLYGLGGNDFLDGGPGADALYGGTGDDTYVIENIGDSANELPGEGTDEILTGFAAYSLFGQDNIENLTASSDVNHDFRGNSGNNVVIGGAGNDTFRMQDGGVDSAIGGNGNDFFLFGAGMTSADSVDGGLGTDQVAIQGNYTLTFGAGFRNIESLIPLPGNDVRFGDSGTNFYDYDLTAVDANLLSGQRLMVDANRLRVGEDFTFNGSAETDGNFFLVGGHGVDTFTGGLQNDTFLFGENGQFGASDTVNGGPGGGNDQFALRGNYTVTFGAGQMIGIESIALVSAQDTRFGPLGSVYHYNLTMHDDNAAAGVLFTIDGGNLRGGETLTVDASAETDASYRIAGGAGADTITGGQQFDLIIGRIGADTLRGGGGNDVFRIDAVTESNAAGRDSILDFTNGDRIDLSRMDANSTVAGDQAFTFIGSAAFGNQAGELRFESTGGNTWLIQGDVDGNGVADFEVSITIDDLHPLSAADFIL